MSLRAVGRRLSRARFLATCERLSISRPIWLISHTPSQAYRGRLDLGARTIHDEYCVRHASSSSSSSASSTRWKTRQSSDRYAKEAKVANLKSRAAFKLLEIDSKHRILKAGDTVVDLGYAPGSWAQVAISRTAPGGRVVGIDVIPAQPPRGVSTIQGDFLSEDIREEVRKFVQVPGRGRPRPRSILGSYGGAGVGGVTEDELEEENKGLLELERASSAASNGSTDTGSSTETLDGKKMSQKELDVLEGRVVDVVLSDMMTNTSGTAFRDHAGSMDLCNAALSFVYSTLSTGGHFLCKFYQGAEDQALEQRLKRLFEKVHRIKPESSRKESKEAYLLGLRRRAGVAKADVVDEDG